MFWVNKKVKREKTLLVVEVFEGIYGILSDNNIISGSLSESLSFTENYAKHLAEDGMVISVSNLKVLSEYTYIDDK